MSSHLEFPRPLAWERIIFRHPPVRRGHDRIARVRAHVAAMLGIR